MKTFKIGDDGDLEIAAGTLTPLEGEEALRQAVRSRLRTIGEEWFLNESIGLPWDTIYAKNPNKGLIEAAIRAQTVAVEGIDSVSSVSIEVDSSTRDAEIEVVAVKSTGDELEVEV